MESFFSSININCSVSDFVTIVGSLTGLLSVIFTLYSKKREANIKDAELELKKKHFIADKNHSISKEKYQFLFEKKIDLYVNLHRQVSKLNRQLYKVGHLINGYDANGNFIDEEITEDKLTIDSLTDIFKLIEADHFLITAELDLIYNKVFDLYKKSTSEFDFLYSVGAMDYHDAQDSWPDLRKKIYQEHKDQIQALFNQIELDTKEIKSKIDGI